jgi:uncharacterized protein (DUF342 family)
MPDENQQIVEPKARIDIVDNNMKAYLIPILREGEQWSISGEEIWKLLTDSRVTYGIKEEVIDTIAEGKTEGTRFLVAEGSYPVAGRDSSLEFFFSTSSSFKPKILEDGRIDYKDVELVKSVLKDTVLIKKTLSTQGTSGKDLMGKDLKAVAGKNSDISLGQGVCRDPKDNTVIKSCIDGIIFYDEKKSTLEVQKLYKVQKSVDYHTGNINVKSSVDIEGDIKPYFTVTTPYDVQIKGIVDNASVNCGGSLSVTGGIVGDGKQFIKVGGDLHTAYINNQHVRCSGCVYVNKEIRNSIIECDDEIVMVGGSAVIIGGKISAANKIVAAIVGNAYSVHTEIRVGVKLEFADKYQQKCSEKKAMYKKIEEIKAEIADLTEGNPDDTKAVDALFGRLEECEGMYNKMLKDLGLIENDYYNSPNPVLQITGRIYPGTMIRIKHALYEVTDELSRVEFKLEDDKVIYNHLVY